MECNNRFFWIRCCVETTQKVDGNSNQGSVVDGWLMLMIANKEGKGCEFVFLRRENREKLHGANGTWFYKVTIQLESDKVEHDLWEELEAGNPVGEFVSLKDYIQDPHTTHSLLDMYGRSIFIFLGIVMGLWYV